MKRGLVVLGVAIVTLFSSGCAFLKGERVTDLYYTKMYIVDSIGRGYENANAPGTFSFYKDTIFIGATYQEVISKSGFISSRMKYKILNK